MPCIIDEYVAEAKRQIMAGNDGMSVFFPLYNAWMAFKADPLLLQIIQRHWDFAEGLLVLLSYKPTNDINDIQQLTSVSYLFFDFALANNPKEVQIYRSRCHLMNEYSIGFKYTVSAVVNKDVNPFSFAGSLYDINIRDALYKMQYFDLTALPNICDISPYNELKELIESKMRIGMFGDNANTFRLKQEGEILHQEMFRYIWDKVFDGSLDF